MSMPRVHLSYNPKPGSGVSHGFTPPRSATDFETCVDAGGLWATKLAVSVGFLSAAFASAAFVSAAPDSAPSKMAKPAAQSLRGWRNRVRAGIGPQPWRRLQ